MAVSLSEDGPGLSALLQGSVYLAGSGASFYSAI